MAAMTIASPTKVRTSEPPADEPGTLGAPALPSFRLTGVFSPVAPNASATSSSSTDAVAAAAVRKGLGIRDGEPVEGSSGSLPLSAIRPGGFNGRRREGGKARRRETKAGGREGESYCQWP